VPDKLTKTPEFYEATRGARRVMLLDLGFLGDSIHLLPALWVLRQAYPDAELHVMVSEHVTKHYVVRALSPARRTPKLKAPYLRTVVKSLPSLGSNIEILTPPT
jgi:hypothetical protein